MEDVLSTLTNTAINCLTLPLILVLLLIGIPAGVYITLKFQEWWHNRGNKGSM